jgi:hypothetical protein
MRQFLSIDDCRARHLNGTTPAPGLPLIISYEQCRQECGVGYGRYPVWSVVSALTDWVIPLFLLLGNITYSKSASRVFKLGRWNCGPWLNWVAVISHLLVNPIDFLWNLALKLDSGRAIKERIDRICQARRQNEPIRPQISMKLEERKFLCGICYALEDFENGRHVKTLLRPLEVGSQDDATSYWEAISPLLESTARNIAGDRRHNKFHSVLAIIVYGKDVFVALLQSHVDQNFPYHMPHTLALRQLYYWLFCAIILSGTAGGFADQWSSHAFLTDFLDGRMRNLKAAGTWRDDIVLRPIEPWDGGNYSWKYPKRGQNSHMSGRQKALLLPAIAAVALPVAIAFIMSWYTPTTGLGDRGIMELAFAGMWILDFLVTLTASLVLGGRTLFKIYIWNTFWSLGSLYVLFGAFQGNVALPLFVPVLTVHFVGWYNNCKSWSAYFSKGASEAFIDLNMRDTIQKNIFKFYLPMTAASLVTQLSIAGLIIWINWDVTRFTTWSDDENRGFFDRRRRVEGIEMGRVPYHEDQSKRGLLASEQGLPAVASEEWTVSFEEDRLREQV